MNIVISKPPNYDKILEAIPSVKDYPNAIFCYGDTIYNPANVDLPPWKIAHEEAHSREQEACGSVEWWWEMYLKEAYFRFDEEVIAYRIEFVEFCLHNKDRNLRIKYLRAIGSELANPIYGDKCPLEKAMRLIKGYE